MSRAAKFDGRFTKETRHLATREERMASLRPLALGWLLLLSLGPWQSPSQAQLRRPTPPPKPPASFTVDQATKGAPLYQKHCATCHGAKLQGEQVAPALTGPRFDTSWRGKSAAVIGFHMRRMPPEPVDAPGGLGDETYTAILAYILQANGFAAGDAALPASLDALREVGIPQSEGAAFDPDAPVVAAGQSELLNALPPVTPEMLRNPSPDDWLQTQRTYDSQTWSPLDGINKENVRYLTIAWRAPLRAGSSMPMPIVHAGVMFLHTFPDTTLALDATNGKVLWRHQYQPTGPSSQKMGVALSDDKVLVPTSDLHVLALDARTGELIWDHAIVAPTTTVDMSRGIPAMYQLRSPPLVVGDKVIQGVTASFVPKGGFAIAIDIDSGKEVWRFNTIARPGEPNGESWNDVPLEKRSGGSIWHQASYDPELDLVYFGIAPTYDTGPLVHPVDNKAVNSNALYTNCTVAIRPETGKLAWYYQHMPNDQWDLDWVFERQIVTVPVDGKPRKAVMNVGKMAVVEAVDAATGEYLFSVDAGIQNVITAIDPKTGAKTIDPAKWPDPEHPTDICPSAFGARSWPPTSYDPKTAMLYLPLTESCMHLGAEGFRLLTSGVGISRAVHPASADHKIGRLQAVDVANRKLAWERDVVTPVTTGMLSTAGGVVFAGDMSPSLMALDAATGDLLWQTKLDDSPSSSVITYKVKDKQYVAVVLGLRNFHIDALDGVLQGFTDVEVPKGDAPKGGAAIWVYAL
jgi:alcohol dehydrogenase (cytochrome c)